MGLLDFVRSRSMSRAGAVLQAMLDKLVHQASFADVEQSESNLSKTAVRDLESIQKFMTSPAYLALFDIFWTPIFLVVISIFHPWLGYLAVSGGAVLIAIAILGQYFTKNKWDVCLYHCIYNEDKLPTDKDINDSLFDGNYTLCKINTIQFPKSIKFPFHYLWNSYRYSKIIYKQIIDDLDHFDFILIKGFSGWKLLNLKVRGLKTPPVGINFHGMNMFLPPPNLKLKLSNIIFSYFTKINLSNADYIFSYGAKVTDTIAKSLENQSKIIEIPTGIDHSWIRNKNTVLANNKRRFVFVGRNDPLKGIKILNQIQM